MSTVNETRDELGVAPTCAALGLSRATYYRRRWGEYEGPSKARAVPRKLAREEREQVLGVLHEDRFADWAPAQVQAQLLSEGTYLCSVRTMHRILAENIELRERRDQLRHPQYTAPELLATAPNQVWSWDITKLLGPEKWTYFYLYVLMDIYSRYIVGWLLADRESGSLAKKLIGECCEREGIQPGQLVVHSDRGGPMTSKTLAQLYADLGVTKTHSRPHVSDDNPFSEAVFKTLKYRPEFPERFGSHEHARACSADLIGWYNHDHHHGNLAYLTPHDVHHGHAEQRLAERAVVLEAAYRAHPERFVHGPPQAPTLPEAVWINPPKQTGTAPAHPKNEAGPEGPAPSVLPPARRSGCSSAEPYPPCRHADGTPPCDAHEKTRNDGARPTMLEPHPDAPCAKNLGGAGAEPLHCSAPSTPHEVRH